VLHEIKEAVECHVVAVTERHGMRRRAMTDDEPRRAHLMPPLSFCISSWGVIGTKTWHEGRKLDRGKSLEKTLWVAIGVHVHLDHQSRRAEKELAHSCGTRSYWPRDLRSTRAGILWLRYRGQAFVWAARRIHCVHRSSRSSRSTTRRMTRSVTVEDLVDGG